MLPSRFALLLALAASTAAAQPLTRVAATSLRFGTAPTPARYSTARAFPMAFSQPLALVTPPGESRRLFIVEKTGRIWVIPDTSAASPTRTLFLDLSANVAVAGGNDERGLLALAFHPSYAANGQFFVWYTLNTTTAAGTGLHDRLARFRVSADPNAADAASEQPLITQRDEAANHNGGELLFGPDGYLYLSLGDEGGGNDQFQNSQRIDRDFFAGIIRIDVDRLPGSLPPNPHPAIHASSYSVPGDNPFVGATTFNGAAVAASAVRTEFWAVGLRNPWRMSFDPATGLLWCGDVGQAGREEIDLIVRGGNYGWSYREGTLNGPRANPPAGATLIAPVWEYPSSGGASVTGGFVYRGSRHPELVGKYLFADFVTGQIWSLTPNGTNAVGPENVQLLATDGGIASFGIDPSNGDILLADLTENAIKRLVATPGSGAPSLPATLSATGAFASVAALTPAPGVVGYEPRVPHWADHARARHWFALPDLSSTFHYTPGQIRAAPPGAVFLQHFDLELRRGDPASARRVETRALVFADDGRAYGASYRWNDAQTEATLVPADGAEQAFSVTENGLTRTQRWQFPSRAQCLGCHVSTAGADAPFVHHALGFGIRQLNRDHAFPGGTANILRALSDAGYFSAPISAETLRQQPGLASPADPSATLEDRARAYLDVNCGSCHRPAGPTPGSWNATAGVPLDHVLLDNRGDPAQRLLAPGDIVHSELLARLAGTRSPRMPPIGTLERDREGERLIAEWIVSLHSSPSPAPGSIANLAARAAAGGAGSELITGFVISPGGTKTVLVRAVGPRLADFGVPDALSQPVLTVFRDAATIAANTRWTSAANAGEIRAVTPRVGAFALPENGADSALLLTLAPGAYTAQVGAPAGDPGNIALVEIYDADPAGPARLLNASIRGRVGAGANLLIPGLVIGPGATKTLLVRAIGPGLREFGVGDPLAQPVLDLFAGPQDFAQNIGWGHSPRASAIRDAARAVGAFALAEGGRDSALLITLSPGAYTIQVSGANNTTGAALAEVYEVP